MKIYSIGGYNEVGKNMTAVETENEAIIVDMGLFLPKIIGFEEEERKNLTTKALIKIGAIPDDSVLGQIKGKIKAIVLGHSHLDHIGATAYLAQQYKIPIIGTPYTLEVLKTMLSEEHIDIRNQLKVIHPNSRIKLGNIEIELINMTHSTPQTSLVCISSDEGTILYANDFKFDNHPIIGKPPNYKRLEHLGNEGVLALIVESLYARKAEKTPSEKVAKEMLKDVMLGTDNKNNLVIVTCFASHIARIKSIIEFGLKLNRKIVILGRSMHKYIFAAEKINIVKFSKKTEIIPYSKSAKRKLKQIEKEGRSKYLIICTGSQGEPNSILEKIATNKIPFELLPDDHIIFSCRTIPVPENIENRAKLEEKLKKKKVRIFKDIHVSGHASKEDLRDLINMIKPKHIIPAHGPTEMLNDLADLSEEIGYKRDKNVHILHNGRNIEVS